jgi:hypothetical protein
LAALAGQWQLPGGQLEIRKNHEIRFSGDSADCYYNHDGDIKWENANRFTVVNYFDVNTSACPIKISRLDGNNAQISRVGGTSKWCECIKGSMRRIKGN